MGLINEDNQIPVVIPLGSVTTDGTVLPAVHIAKKSKIVAAHVINGASVVASDSNYVQLSLKNGSNVVGSLDSRAAHENGLVANAGKALNLVSDYQVIDAGSDLSVLYNETGTVGLTNAVLVLTLYAM